MMARRSLFRALAAVAAAPLLAGCGSLLAPASYRYRMTVIAMTPEGERRGSAVHEVMAYRAPKITSEERPVRGELHGEAVILDLPSGETVFALLKPEDGGRELYSTVTRALVGKSDPMSDFDLVGAVRSLGGWFGQAEAELPRDHWPLMVRFRDINDPASVERVDPESLGIHRITVVTTSENKTHEIIDRLAWLPRHRGSLSKRPTAYFSRNPPLAYQLTERSFSTELTSVE